MGKMVRLVKNEMIKLVKRKSLPVMLIVTVILSVGVVLLFNFSRVAEDSSGEEYLVEEWKKEIVQLERFFAPDHYLDNAYADNSDRGRRFRNRSLMLQYLVDNGYSPYDWRYTSGIVEEMFEHKLQMDINYNYDKHKAEYDRLEGLIQADDWKTYYKGLAEQQLATYAYLYPMAEAEVLDAVWYEYNYRTEHDFRPGNERWRDELISSVASSKLSLAYFRQQEYARNTPGYINPSTGDPSMEKPELTLEQIAENRAAVLDKLAVATYRLDHNIKADIGYVFGEESVVSAGGKSVFWESFAASSEFIIVVGVLVIIIAGLIVAGEFSSGTIKFLLVSPVKRWKIVMAKYVTVLSLAVVFTLVMYLASAAASLAVFGTYGFDDSVVLVKDGVAWGVSPFLKVFGYYGWAFVEVVVVATMAFCLSSLMRSTAVSIGVGLFAYLSGTALVELLSNLGLDFGRYILFANLDLPAVMANTSIFPNQTLIEAIVIIVAHMAVFIWTAWDGFVRREI